MTASIHHHQAPQPRKISETFLNFLSPILAMMGDQAGEAEIESALKIGFTVWNSMVLDVVDGNSVHAAYARSVSGVAARKRCGSKSWCNRTSSAPRRPTAAMSAGAAG